MLKKLLGLGSIFVLSTLVSCSDVNVNDKLPIDGKWSYNLGGINEDITIKNGVGKGSLGNTEILNLKQLDATHYEGVCGYSLFMTPYHWKCTLIVSENGFIIKDWKFGTAFVKNDKDMVAKPVSLDDESRFYASIWRTIVKPNPTLERVVTKAIVFRPYGDATQTVEDSEKVRHEITLFEKQSADGHVGAHVQIGNEYLPFLARLQGEVRGELEKATQKTYAVEEVQRRQVSLKGGKTYKVEWVDYYRTGIATMVIKGKEVNVPFRFKEEFALEASQP